MESRLELSLPPTLSVIHWLIAFSTCPVIFSELLSAMQQFQVGGRRRQKFRMNDYLSVLSPKLFDGHPLLQLILESEWPFFETYVFLSFFPSPRLLQEQQELPGRIHRKIFPHSLRFWLWILKSFWARWEPSYRNNPTKGTGEGSLSQWCWDCVTYLALNPVN